MFLLTLFTMVLAQEPQEPPKKPPFRYNFGVGGMWIAGNLNQMQFNTSGLITYDKNHMGNDLLINGYRIYMKPQGVEDFIRIGDDLSITTIPFYYFHPHIYGFGIGHWSTSLLHRIDSRIFAGGGVGYAPVRRPNFLVRAGFGAFYEQTAFPEESFNIDIEHDGRTRSVARVGLISNGWFRPKGSSVSLRYFGRFLINPMAPEDYRFTIDGSSNWHIYGPISLRLGILYASSSVVVEGVETFDLRSNLGISFSNRNGK